MVPRPELERTTALLGARPMALKRTSPSGPHTSFKAVGRASGPLPTRLAGPGGGARDPWLSEIPHHGRGRAARLRFSRDGARWPGAPGRGVMNMTGALKYQPRRCEECSAPAIGLGRWCADHNRNAVYGQRGRTNACRTCGVRCYGVHCWEHRGND